jgi:hypothetical protein
LWNVDSILSLTLRDIAVSLLIVVKVEKNTESHINRCIELKAPKGSGSVAFDPICAIPPESKSETTTTNVIETQSRRK